MRFTLGTRFKTKLNADSNAKVNNAKVIFKGKISVLTRGSVYKFGATAVPGPFNETISASLQFVLQPQFPSWIMRKFEANFPSTWLPSILQHVITPCLCGKDTAPSYMGFSKHVIAWKSSRILVCSDSPQISFLRRSWAKGLLLLCRLVWCGSYNILHLSVIRSLRWIGTMWVWRIVNVNGAVNIGCSMRCMQMWLFVLDPLCGFWSHGNMYCHFKQL